MVSSSPNPENWPIHRNWFYSLIDKVPIGLAERISNIAPLIPSYHIVSNERIIHVCHLYPYKNESQFINDIEFLCKRYEPVSLPDVLDHVRHGKTLKNGSFLLTFDDGYSQMYSVVAPILLKKGIPAVFFLTTDLIDNKVLFYKNKASIIIEFIMGNEAYIRDTKQKFPLFANVPLHNVPGAILSISIKNASILDKIGELMGIRFNEYLKVNQPYLSRIQIRRMIEMGFSFGAHSLNHPHYADIKLEDEVSQTIGSLLYMKKEFSLPYSVFAFPYNDIFVTREFFRRIGNHADLTFGTSGIFRDPISSNLQRIDFGNNLNPAKNIMTHEFIRKRIYTFLNKIEIKRK